MVAPVPVSASNSLSVNLSFIALASPGSILMSSELNFRNTLFEYGKLASRNDEPILSGNPKALTVHKRIPFSSTADVKGVALSILSFLLQNENYIKEIDLPDLSQVARYISSCSLPDALIDAVNTLYTTHFQKHAKGLLRLPTEILPNIVQDFDSYLNLRSVCSFTYQNLPILEGCLLLMQNSGYLMAHLFSIIQAHSENSVEVAYAILHKFLIHASPHVQKKFWMQIPKDFPMERLLDKPFPQVTRIGFEGPIQLLIKLITQCPDLKELIIDESRKLSEELLSAILKCTQLEILDISSLVVIPSDLALLADLPAIRELHVTVHDSPELLALSDKVCQLLRTLYFHEIKDIEISATVPFIRKCTSLISLCLPTLSTLTVLSNSITELSLFAPLINQLPPLISLKKLTFWGPEDNLQHLIVALQKMVDLTVLEAIITSKIEVKHLSQRELQILKWNIDYTQENIQKLAPLCSTLQELYLSIYQFAPFKLEVNLGSRLHRLVLALFVPKRTALLDALDPLLSACNPEELIIEVFSNEEGLKQIGGIVATFQPEGHKRELNLSVLAKYPRLKRIMFVSNWRQGFNWSPTIKAFRVVERGIYGKIELTAIDIEKAKKLSLKHSSD